MDTSNKKRKCHFNDNWLQEYTWLKKVNDSQGLCKYCLNTFSIELKGVSAIKQHENSENHRSKMKASASSQLMENFVIKKDTPEELQVIAIELAHIYHAVNHNQSYNSLDCLMKLVPKTLPKDNNSCKISCGRTKAQAIVENVLGPKILEDVITEIKTNDSYFSIMTDASNKKNRKFFPLVVQYFSRKDGLQQNLIDFYENCDESADGMFACINDCFKDLDLDFSKVTALSADNTNANFGRIHSLFVNLQKVNPNIVKANCHAHILHNALRYALEDLSVDIENLVLKINAHFSLSSVRRSKFQDFCEFLNVSFTDFSRHVVTRWLSLQPCVERLLREWPALVSYFHSNVKNLSVALKNALHFKNEEIPATVEMNLLFANHVLAVFEKPIKLLQKDSTTIIDLYAILNDFKQQLSSRIEKQFFGYEVMQKLKDLTFYEKQKFEKEFSNVYSKALSYVEKRFECDEQSVIEKLSKLKVNNSELPEFEMFAEIVELLHISNINMNKLFDEIVFINKHLKHLVNSPDWQTKYSTTDKWTFIFQNISSDNSDNLFKIMSYILSMPASSSFIERVFSIMIRKWTDERNKCSVELIKAELLISVNCKEHCVQFYEKVRNNIKLLKCAKSDEKYKFRHRM